MDWLVDSGASGGGLSGALVGGQARLDPLDGGRAEPGRLDHQDEGRLNPLVAGRPGPGLLDRQHEGRLDPLDLDRAGMDRQVLGRVGQGPLDRQVLARVGSYLDSARNHLAGEVAEAAELAEQPDAAPARLP